jgi:hypothetical protein
MQEQAFHFASFTGENELRFKAVASVGILRFGQTVPVLYLFVLSHHFTLKPCTIIRGVR